MVSNFSLPITFTRNKYRMLLVLISCPRISVWVQPWKYVAKNCWIVPKFYLDYFDCRLVVMILYNRDHSSYLPISNVTTQGSQPAGNGGSTEKFDWGKLRWLNININKNLKWTNEALIFLFLKRYFFIISLAFVVFLLITKIFLLSKSNSETNY
jgi:hypothetical protein